MSVLSPLLSVSPLLPLRSLLLRLLSSLSSLRRRCGCSVLLLLRLPSVLRWLPLLSSLLLLPSLSLLLLWLLLLLLLLRLLSFVTKHQQRQQ